MLLDGLRQLRVTVLRTEELCVRLCSIEAVLRGSGDRRDHLPLCDGERAGFAAHHLLTQCGEPPSDARMGGDEPKHLRDEPVTSLDAELMEQVARRQLHPRVCRIRHGDDCAIHARGAQRTCISMGALLVRHG